MPLTLDSFINIARQTSVGSRDIVVRGEGENAQAKLGNFVFSHSNKTNAATMAAFREALRSEYGSLGVHAFESVVGARAQTKKSLRACDIKSTLSNLATIRNNRFAGELERQLDTHPAVLELKPKLQEKLRAEINKNLIGKTKLDELKTPADISAAASKRIETAIEEVLKTATSKDAEKTGFGVREDLETEAKPNEATGLRNIKNRNVMSQLSVGDQVKKGFAGEGMRVNRSSTHPVLLEKLKTNGVEPGFIFRNDWSTEDTRGYMSNINSEANRAALDELKAKDPAFAQKCQGKSLREQILLAGRAHPAAMAAAAELMLEEAAKYIISGGKDGNGQDLKASDAVKDLAKALRNHFANPDDIKRLADQNGKPSQAVVEEAKRYLFTQIRDAVMNVKPGDAEYSKSGVFKHFQDRSIEKLDYNESERFSAGPTASAGTFMRPERVATGRKMGQLYRFQTRATADSISAGAVTEALANDLTRVAGVPSQELEIIRGKYSDGHPKIMLAAKFANGYQDMEAGMLKDGRIVPPPGNPNMKMESLGKYKAFFLATADRDGVGKRGQNKGFVNGKFFAIDPGHSLEGNGKYLKVSDDLSFKDTYGKSTKPRFNNFSVFDDDTRYAKFEGVLNLRELVVKDTFKKVFDEYRATFNPKEPGLDAAEIALREKIVDDINKKETEFYGSIKKILTVNEKHLQLFDDLADKGPAVQQGAIETIANLEKLTSPTTWVSKKGKVALKHLEVIPETRVPWKAFMKGDSLVFTTETKIPYETQKMLGNIAKTAGGRLEPDALGSTRLELPLDAAEKFIAAFSEEKVQQLTHPEEYMARKMGGDGIKEAKTYTPLPYKAPAADPRPLMKVEDLPDVLDVPVDGKIYRLPKIHYQDLVTTRSHMHRPRNEGELRFLLQSQIRRGREVLGALMEGRPNLFEPTHENIVALTYAIHATALTRGEFMYRGSFSIEDKNGDIARWLDKAQDVYLRTSTHAKPYQGMKVDGHVNMPRGYDVPPGAGGLLNGMRTFHYFSIPDHDSIAAGGDGSGPRRRLFLKCETFGIFCSTAHAHPFNKAAAKTEGMKTRGYKFGDVFESIRHGASLFASFFTPKEANGIRKENLTVAQKTAIQNTLNRLNREHLGAYATILSSNKVLEGAGINQLWQNTAMILEKMMPPTEEARAVLMDILEELAGALDEESVKGGFTEMRIGNEIMIDQKDL